MFDYSCKFEVMLGDLIVSRGERGSDCFFIILAGSVKVIGHSERGAHEIYASDEFPFFGVAEMLAKNESGKVEHRSVFDGRILSCY